MLRQFLNALTADDKYSGSNMQSFPATISNAIISETNDFFWFFISFLKCAWNLEHFQKKDEYPSLIISAIIDPEKRGYLKL